VNCPSENFTQNVTELVKQYGEGEDLVSHAMEFSG
jgi:hypothetical protein